MANKLKFVLGDEGTRPVSKRVKLYLEHGNEGDVELWAENLDNGNVWILLVFKPNGRIETAGDVEELFETDANGEVEIWAAGESDLDEDDEDET